jgi:hypothetical protein
MDFPLPEAAPRTGLNYVELAYEKYMADKTAEAGQSLSKLLGEEVPL